LCGAESTCREYPKTVAVVRLKPPVRGGGIEAGLDIDGLASGHCEWEQSLFNPGLGLGQESVVRIFYSFFTGAWQPFCNRLNKGSNYSLECFLLPITLEDMEILQEAD
jgi:hypothetical protein